MRLLALPLLLLGAIVSVSLAAAPHESEADDRLAASFLIALGRLPHADERAQWSQSEQGSVTDLLNRHREHLQRDAATRRQVAFKAERDALGVSGKQSGPADKPAPATTYFDQVQAHLESLRADPAAYEAVIRRAYPMVIGREAYPEELSYWKKYDVLPFALLAAAIENWARRNQPGLMVTVGTPTVSEHSRFVEAVSVSPTLAAELRTALGLSVPLSGAGGRNLIAPGGRELVTNGHRHVVAAGATETDGLAALR